MYSKVLGLEASLVIQTKREYSIEHRGIEEKGFQSPPRGGVRFSRTAHFPLQAAHWLRLPRLAPSTPSLAQLPAQDGLDR
jgi:hypothetical protein